VLASERRRFDAVVARCAGAQGAILDLGSRLVNPGGIVVVSGHPDPHEASRAESVRVANPLTGSSRHFLVLRRA
jgi:hypothetical protein